MKRKKSVVLDSIVKPSLAFGSLSAGKQDERKTATPSDMIVPDSIDKLSTLSSSQPVKELHIPAHKIRWLVMAALFADK